MGFCVKSFVFRKGINVSKKIFLSKQRASGIAYVYDKLGFYNNFTNSLDSNILFLNINKFVKIAHKEYKMNKEGYKVVGTILENKSNKERWNYSFTFFTRANGFKGSDSAYLQGVAYS